MESNYEKVRRKGFIIVEGQLDVIMAHQAGSTNAVALSGSAFTDDHIKQLTRYTNKITLAFDGDEAGRKAIDRALEKLKTHTYFNERREVKLAYIDRLIKERNEAPEENRDALDNEINEAIVRYDFECDCEDEAEKEHRIQLKEVLPRNPMDLVEHFLIGLKGSSKMIKEMIRDRKEYIGKELMKLKRESSHAFFEEIWQSVIDKKMKEIKNLTFLLSCFPKKSKVNDENRITLEMTIRAKQVPITNYIQFDQSGFAKCPFHSEKTGSLKYYKDINKVHCFGGCGSKDVIDIIMHMTNCDFKSAVRTLLS